MVRIGRIEPATRPPRPRRRWRRRAVVSIAALAVVVGVGVPAGVAVFGPGALQDAANARMRGRLTVAAARFAWPCRLELRGLVLADERGRPVARIARVEVEVELVASAMARPTGRVAIADPWVDLFLDADGESALLRALAAPDAGGVAPVAPSPVPLVDPPPAAPPAPPMLPPDPGIPLPDVDVAVFVTGASAVSGDDLLLGPLEADLRWSGADAYGAVTVRETRADAIEVDVRARSTRPGFLDPAALVVEVHRLSVDRLPLARLHPYLARAADVAIDRGELTLSASGRWAAGGGEGQASLRLTGLECHGPWSGGVVLRPPEVALRVQARGGGSAPVDVLVTVEAGELGTLGVELRLDPDPGAAPEAAAASLGVATARLALAPLAALARPWIPVGAPRLDGTLEATAQLRRTQARGSALRVEARVDPRPPPAGEDGALALPTATLSIDAGRADPTAPLAVARATLGALGCRGNAHLALGTGLALAPGAGGARLEGELGRLSRALPPSLGLPLADGAFVLDLAWEAARDDATRSARATLALAGGALELASGRVGPVDLDWEQPATVVGWDAERIVLGKGTLAGGGLAIVVSGEVLCVGRADGPEGALAVVGSIDPGPLCAALGRLAPVALDGDSITVDLRAQRAGGRERLELALSGADLAWRLALEDPSAPAEPGTLDDYELALALERAGSALALESLWARVGRTAIVADGALAFPQTEGDVPSARLAVAADLEGTDVARLLAPILHGWSFDAHAAIDVVASADAAGQRARFEVDLAHGSLACGGERVWEERALAVGAALERPGAAIDYGALAAVAIALERLDVRGPSARLRAHGTASPADLVDLFYALGPLAPPTAPAAARRIAIEGAISPDAHHAAQLARLLGLSSLATALDLRLVHEVRGGAARFEVDAAGRAEVGLVSRGTWAEPALALGFSASTARDGRELAARVRLCEGRVDLAGHTRAEDYGTAVAAADGVLDLAGIVARARAAGVLSPGAAVSGSASVALGLTARNGRTRVVVALGADPVRVVPVGAAPIEEVLAVRAYLAADRDARRVAVEHLVLDGPTVAGVGRASVAWPAGDGDARLEQASLDLDYHPTRAGRWLALVAPDVVLAGERRQRASVDLAGRLPAGGGALAVLRGLEGRAAIDTDALDAGGYRFVGRSRFALVEAVLRSQHRYAMSGEEARAGVVLDLREGAAVRSRVALSLKHVVVRTEHARWLAYLNPLFYVGSAAEGKLDGCVGIDVDATYAAPLVSALAAGGWEALDKRPLAGVLRLDVVGLNALQSPFLDKVNDVLALVGPRLVPTFEPLSLSIRGERLYYDRVLRMVLGDNALYLDGSIGFDGTVDMEMVVPLVPGTLGKLPLVDRLPKPEIKIPLRGTLGAPLFELDAVLRDLVELIPDSVNPFGGK